MGNDQTKVRLEGYGNYYHQAIDSLNAQLGYKYNIGLFKDSQCYYVIYSKKRINVQYKEQNGIIKAYFKI